MTSGQTSPVVLMGGKVKEDGNIPGGYDDIYGPQLHGYQIVPLVKM